MALTNQLPIYKVAYDLLDSVTDSVRSMPRRSRFLFGCDGRLQVHLDAMRVICTREETAAVGRMMSALEPVWNI